MAVAKNKKSITISLEKEIIDAMDKVIRVINEENEKKPLNKREAKCTRSTFIRAFLIKLFTDVDDKEEDTKGKKGDLN